MTTHPSKQLVWKSVDHPRTSILSTEFNKSISSSFKLFNDIFNISKEAKLTISKKGYFYTPSREYLEFRAKFRKK